jgi:hypothetical protein
MKYENEHKLRHDMDMETDMDQYMNTDMDMKMYIVAKCSLENYYY